MNHDRLARIYSDPANHKELIAYANRFNLVRNSIDATDLIQEAMTRALNYNQIIDNPIGLLKRIMRYIIYDKSRRHTMICKNQHLITNKYRITNESDIADDLVKELASFELSAEVQSIIDSLTTSQAAFARAMIDYPDESIANQAKRAKIPERTAYRIKKDLAKNADLCRLFSQMNETDPY